MMSMMYISPSFFSSAIGVVALIENQQEKKDNKNQENSVWNLKIEQIFQGL
jgi:hypothetical protein